LFQTMNQNQNMPKQYPLPIERALADGQEACNRAEASDADGVACHEAALRLADYLIYYLGAVAVGQYSQALYTGQIEPDPTLNRSLRSLRRVTRGQWLLWVARSLQEKLRVTNYELRIAGSHSSFFLLTSSFQAWYEGRVGGEVAQAYKVMRDLMVEQLAYTGEYGPQESVSPRLLLELVDQYQIRLAKTSSSPGMRNVEGEDPALREQGRDVQSNYALHITHHASPLGGALFKGLRSALEGASFITEYQLYAPQARRLLMGPKATAPMPPISAPEELAASATILLYPPGEVPDYTKRPNLQAERAPLFPLDPLLVYQQCPQCDSNRVTALREVAGGTPSYLGLDPDCGHTITNG